MQQPCLKTVHSKQGNGTSCGSSFCLWQRCPLQQMKQAASGEADRGVTPPSLLTCSTRCKGEQQTLLDTIYSRPSATVKSKGCSHRSQTLREQGTCSSLIPVTPCPKRWPVIWDCVNSSWGLGYTHIAAVVRPVMNWFLKLLFILDLKTCSTIWPLDSVLPAIFQVLSCWLNLPLGFLSIPHIFVHMAYSVHGKDNYTFTFSLFYVGGLFCCVYIVLTSQWDGSQWLGFPYINTVKIMCDILHYRRSPKFPNKSCSIN